MNRMMVYLAALAAVGGTIYLAGQTRAQAPAAAPAAAPAPKPATGRVAVFNVAKVMKEYTKFQYFAITMQNRRITEASTLAKYKSELMDLQQQLEREQVIQKKEEIQRQLIAKQREFEDKGLMARKAFEEESITIMRNLYGEIQTVVKAVADTNGFDMVMAYPDAITAEDLNSPMYMDVKLRPQAAMPFYVSPSVDMTKIVIDTLNTHFKAPGEIPKAVQPSADLLRVSGQNGGQAGGQPQR